MNAVNQFLQRKIVITCIAICFALFLFNVPFSIVPWLEDKGPTWLGLDCSFQITMNFALYKKLIWGKQIIATYGPLAFLCNRVLWTIPKEAVLLFDIFMLFNFACVFRKFLIDHNKPFAILFLFFTLLLLNTHNGSTTAFLIFFFSLFWLYDYQQKRKLVSFLLSSVCVSLCFYMKLNIALFALLLSLAHLVHESLLRLSTKRELTISIVLLAGLVILPSIALNVDLIEYIKSGFFTMQGYNEIMPLYEQHPDLQILVTIGFLLLLTYLCAQIVALYQSGLKTEIFYSLISMMYVFLAWKQSILRNDVQHLSEFFASAIMVVYLGNFNKGFRNKLIYYLPLSLILLVLLSGKLSQHSLSDLVSRRFSAPFLYYKDYKDAQYHEYFANAEKRKIPEPLLKKISDATVDVFPWDVEYLLQNKLNYSPRPDFQSYMTYNSFLQNANYEHYIHQPPKFILYDYDAIDERYPFNDEGIVNAYIAANYALTDTFTSNERTRLLLERKPRAAPVLFKEIKRQRFNMDEQVDVSRYDFVRIVLQQNVKGLIRSYLYKPSALRLNYILSDGNWKSFRTSAGLLTAFVYTKQFVGNSTDFLKLINDEKELLTISKIKLDDNSGNYNGQYVLYGYKFE